MSVNALSRQAEEAGERFRVILSFLGWRQVGGFVCPGWPRMTLFVSSFRQKTAPLIDEKE